MFNKIIGDIEAVRGWHRGLYLWPLRGLVVVLIALNGWVGYAWAEELGWLNGAAKTEITTIATEVGSKPTPKADAEEMGSAPGPTRKPKRKPTVTTSPSATTSASAAPSTKPSSAPAPSEPTTKPPTETPTPDPTTTSPAPGETPTPDDGGDGLPITLPVDPGTIIEGIIE